MPSICAASARVKDAGDLASLGYPELKVTVTDTGFEDVPEELPAGRYLLSVTGKTTKDMGAVAFLSPTPARMSASEVIEILSGMMAAPGQTGQVVIDLMPGEYGVWADDPAAPQQPAMRTVPGDYPEVQEPEAETSRCPPSSARRSRSGSPPGSTWNSRPARMSRPASSPRRAQTRHTRWSA